MTPMSDTIHPKTIVGTAESPRLRWPIYLQLLIPMVSVVLLASVLATAITAYWIALRVRNEQSETCVESSRRSASRPIR